MNPVQLTIPYKKERITFSSEEIPPHSRNMVHHLALNKIIEQARIDISRKKPLDKHDIQSLSNIAEKLENTGRDTVYACLKTLLVASLVATFVVGILLGPPVGGFIALLSLIAYYTASFVIHDSACDVIGTYCPNEPSTTPWYNKPLLGAALPLLGSSLILPLYEVCTRKARLETPMNSQIEQIIDTNCEFYKKHTPEILRYVGKAQLSLMRGQELRKCNDALSGLKEYVLFLSKFDRTMPDLSQLNGVSSIDLVLKTNGYQETPPAEERVS